MENPIKRISREIREHLIGKFGILVFVLFILFLLTGASIGYILGYANGFKTAVNSGLEILKNPEQVGQIIRYFEDKKILLHDEGVSKLNWSCNFTA